MYKAQREGINISGYAVHYQLKTNKQTNQTIMVLALKQSMDFILKSPFIFLPANS